MNLDNLKKELEYDPITGKFFRLRTHRTVKAGDVAGAIVTLSQHSKQYVRLSVFGKYYQAHRLAWNTLHPDDLIGPDEEIDHINHDRTDNRGVNLRKVSKAENMRNKSLYRRNTSGVSGVGFMPEFNLWRARIRVAGGLIYLGCFNTFEAAVEARIAAEIKYDFHKNHGAI